MEHDPLKKNNDPALRRSALGATILSMALNLLLAAGKILCGIVYGAISVTADGFNNLSDCGGNIISVIGIKASDLPADKEHPFGHARSEYISAMALSFLIILLGFELFGQSIDKLVSGSSSEFSLVTVIVLAVSAIVKIGMFFFNRRMGKKCGSELLAATSVDSLSDALATLAVLVSLIVFRFTSFDLDGYVGCLVALVIFVSGIKVLKKAADEQLGKLPSKEVVSEIKRRLLSYDGVYGIHALTVHDYVSRLYASVHVEVDSDDSFLAAHELADRIEQDFAATTNVCLTIHLDPVIMSDPRTLKLRSLIESMFEDRYVIHDFRLVKSEPMRLIFEVGVKNDDPLTDEQIKHDIYERLYGEFGLEYEYFISVERETSA